MLMRLDHYFVEELQYKGYNVTFLELRDLYTRARIRRENERRKRKMRYETHVG